MKIRPGRSVRKINSQAWSRYSVKKPKKNYVKSLPRTSLLMFNMGVANSSYDMTIKLVSKQLVQLRSNALEASRQAVNKYLEAQIPNEYYLRVVVYPHNVIREKKFATGAGADRVSQGMSLAFGKPASVAARVSEGQTVLDLDIMSENKEVAKEAMRRASSKLSGTYSITVTEHPKPAAQKSESKVEKIAA